MYNSCSSCSDLKFFCSSNFFIYSSENTKSIDWRDLSLLIVSLRFSWPSSVILLHLSSSHQSYFLVKLVYSLKFRLMDFKELRLLIASLRFSIPSSVILMQLSSSQQLLIKVAYLVKWNLRDWRELSPWIALLTFSRPPSVILLLLLSSS